MVAPSRSSPIRQCIFPYGAGSIVKHILGRPTAMFKRKPCRMFEFIGSSNLSLVQMKPNEPSITPATAIGVSSSILDLISIMTWRNESWRWICPSLCFKIDRKKLLFITWFPWASLRNFTTLFALFTCKRWRPASDRIQRLRQTLGGSSWCPPRQLRSCRTSLLKKASEQKTQTLPISVHLCQEISTSSLHEFASQVAWARCTGPKRGKWDEARYGSIPKYLRRSITNGQMAKKKLECGMPQRKGDCWYKLVNKADASRYMLSSHRLRLLQHQPPVQHANSKPSASKICMQQIEENALHGSDVSSKMCKHDNLRSVIACRMKQKKTHRNLHIIYLYHSTVQIQIMQRKCSQTSGWPAWTGAETNGMSCRSDLSWSLTCSNDSKLIVLLRGEQCRRRHGSKRHQLVEVNFASDVQMTYNWLIYCSSYSCIS